jgi:hypothetical protein
MTPCSPVHPECVRSFDLPSPEQTVNTIQIQAVSSNHQLLKLRTTSSPLIYNIELESLPASHEQN